MPSPPIETRESRNTARARSLTSRVDVSGRSHAGRRMRYGVPAWHRVAGKISERVRTANAQTGARARINSLSHSAEAARGTTMSFFESSGFSEASAPPARLRRARRHEQSPHDAVLHPSEHGPTSQQHVGEQDTRGQASTRGRHPSCDAVPHRRRRVARGRPEWLQLRSFRAIPPARLGFRRVAAVAVRRAAARGPNRRQRRPDPGVRYLRAAVAHRPAGHRRCRRATAILAASAKHRSARAADAGAAAAADSAAAGAGHATVASVPPQADGLGLLRLILTNPQFHQALQQAATTGGAASLRWRCRYQQRSHRTACDRWTSRLARRSTRLPD